MTDPTSRALTLLGLLESRVTWTGLELAARLGVTTRTLRRDVDRLRELGYVVDAEPGAAGGYSLGRGQVLPPLLLDEDEALAVTLSLATAAASGLAADAEAALRALGKLEDVLPPALRQRSRELRGSVEAVGQPGVDPEVLARASEAVRRRQRLRFSYATRGGESTRRWVEPHHLVAMDQHWYLLAWDIDRADWRTFRLDRAGEPEVSGWEFRRRPDLPAALERMQEGMPTSAYRHQIIVRVAAPLAVLKEHLPPRAGELVAVDDATTDFITGADSPEQAAWWLGWLGHDFTVLADDATRAAVATLGRLLVRAAQ